MPRGIKLKYTENDLRLAIANSTSWRGVMRELGYATRSGGHSAMLQSRARELGLNTRHFRRTTFTNEELKKAVASSTNWSEVMRNLGKNPGNGTITAKTIAERLDLDTTHFGHKRSAQVLLPLNSSFKNATKPGRHTGLSVAAKWFLDHGYMVSIPFETAPYDLVTESDNGLQRVQVKMTSRKQGNHYIATVSHLAYSSEYPRTANGNRKVVPYRDDEVDYFFIITPNSTFLIPISIIAGRCYILLGHKYAAFRV